MSELKLKLFRCYYGTIKKPCGIDIQAIETAILGHALEHVREAHPRFAKSIPDLEARLQEEIQDDVRIPPDGLRTGAVRLPGFVPAQLVALQVRGPRRHDLDLREGRAGALRSGAPAARSRRGRPSRECPELGLAEGVVGVDRNAAARALAEAKLVILH